MSIRVLIFYMLPSEISFLMPLVQRSFISIFQVSTPLVCIFASNTTNSRVCLRTFLPKTLLYTRLIDSTSYGLRLHLYASQNLIWHSENTPPSAYSQLREEILNFPFHRSESCFAARGGRGLLVFVPNLLSFIKSLVRPIFLVALPNVLSTQSSPLMMLMKSTKRNLQWFSIASQPSFRYITQALV